MKKIETGYSPKDIEEKWYKIWEDNNYFHAEPQEGKEKYTIVIPPPNVTGVLHMGHVLNNTIQDVLIRWKRMQGFNALWMPGSDHAGIATQNKVEKKLMDEGKTREDLGRDKFIDEVWKWKEQHGGIITKQLRRLGASLDWQRERFTMDDKLVESVKEIFIKLYKDDMVYRGEYIINWCPRCGTALADDEVDHEEKESYIWEIKYPIKDTNEFITVATTRPETMLGDTAVAVNPNDERYKHLIGKMVILPLMNREIPIVGDDYCDMAFGTGAVKITPAHDPNDFELGMRHKLDVIDVMNKDATMNENAGKYKGLDRFDARLKIIEDLESQGLLTGKKKIKNSVGGCYRCQTIIEPKVSLQWFVRMKPLAEKAIEAVKSGDIKITPKRWEKVYYNWLENIRDWCISRQIWWGHRIPAYYCTSCKETVVASDMPDVCPKCGGTHFVQDNDVLDTWFSSWLWPFSTLGWPDKTPELKYFYPTDTLVTGADILFFWVARMIMAGIYTMDEIPFKDVFLHGIVRDEIGRKMSKSLGNSPDPIDVIDKHGADALRFSMIYSTSQGQDVFYSEKIVEMGGNFANKIWNVSRFVLMNLEGFDPHEVDVNSLNFEIVDNWIFSRMNSAIKETNRHLEKFYLNDAAKSAYDFMWGDFCDWYVETAKARLYNNEDEQSKKTAQFVLWYVLEQGLRLLHPFMPFLTEEIWQKLQSESAGTIVLAEYPVVNEDMINAEVEKTMAFIQEVLKSIRNIRTEMNIAPSKGIVAKLNTAEGEEQVILEENRNYIMKLANLSEFVVGCDIEKPKMAAVKVVASTEIYVDLEGALDKEKEIEKLKKEIEKNQKEVERLDAKLGNQGFLAKANPDVIEKEKEKQKEYKDKIEKLNKNLEMFM